MKPGDVYWIYDAEPGIDHLHVVLTHPEPIESVMQVAVVNITTARGQRYDKTTVLEPGCHERVRKRSYVRYRDADFEKVSEVQERRGYAKAVEPLRDKLFWEIFNKAASSDRTSKKVREYCSRRVGLKTGEILDLKGV